MPTDLDNVQKKEAYHHGDLRQALLNATRALVEEKGPMGFSVSEAARGAGVSTAAPYRHFSDRDEMLEGVAAQGMARMADAFRAALRDQTPGSLDALTAVGVGYVAFAEAEPGVFRLMFSIPKKDGSDLKAEAERGQSVVAEQMAAYLGPEVSQEDAQQRAFALWAFVHGVASLRIDGKAEAQMDEAALTEVIRETTRRVLA